MNQIDPNNAIKDVIMSDGASNVQLGGELLKIHNPDLTDMHGFEHTVSILFSDLKNINLEKTILDHKAIYHIFGSVIFHNPHYIFKLKFY